MAKSNIEVLPEALVWARQRSGYGIEDAAEKLKLSQETLIALEDGLESPSPSLVRKLSHLYGLSPVVFFLQDPPSSGFEAPADFRTIASEKLGQISPALRKEIDRVRAQVAYMNELAAEGVIQSQLHLPLIDPKQAVDDVARSIRDWLGISEQTRAFDSRSSSSLLRAWIAAIESKGILVAQVSGISVQDMRGFCISDASFPMIVLNGADSDSARLFTVVHEIVHIIDGDECLCGGVLGNHGTEARCNEIAASALIPAQRLLSEALIVRYPNHRMWNLDQLSELAAPYGVSREAVLRRLLTLGLTTRSHYQDIRAQLQAQYSSPKSKKELTGGPDRDVMILRNLGRPYVEAVLRARNLGIATDSEVADRLFAKVRWIDVLADRLDMVRP